MATRTRYLAIQSDLPAEGFVRLPEVLKHVPISRSSWYEGIRTGRFPPGVKISERTVAWKVEDIRALISKLNARS